MKTKEFDELFFYIKKVFGVSQKIFDDYKSGGLYILSFKDVKNNIVDLGLEYDQLLDLFFSIKKELNSDDLIEKL